MFAGGVGEALEAVDLTGVFVSLCAVLDVCSGQEFPRFNFLFERFLLTPPPTHTHTHTPSVSVLLRVKALAWPGQPLSGGRLNGGKRGVAALRRD